MAEPVYSLVGKRVFVAGHRGMIGSALVRRLAAEGCVILTAARDELDLERQEAVERWMEQARPDCVIIAAAKVGGILANDRYPVDFLYRNLAIETHLIHAAHRVGVEKLLFLGASCMYPRAAAQPLREGALLTGPLEPTNEWYAVAKIAGLKLCQAYRRQYGCDFIAAIPANLYGPNDNYDPEAGHVVAALIAKMHAAKLTRASEVSLWGTGAPTREFFYVDDCADALIFLLTHYSGEDFLNVGTGVETSIAQLAEETARAVGFTGRFQFDTSKPDGMPRKVMDVSRLLALGWQARTPLAVGLEQAYAWYKAHVAQD